MRHSTAHVMAEAVLDLFPGAKLGIGPAINDGFYYDFELPRALTPADLEAIEERMRASVAADHAFERKEVPFDEGRAIEDADGQPYKVEILDDLARKAAESGTALPPVSFYEHGPFKDLCKGPHVASTGHIGPFKLLAVAGAYWRGDEKRPMLQRIYGTVWETQADLDQYLLRREEAKKRDHRKLGVQLDLYSFHDVSPGSAFWHPKGQRIWRTLESAMREQQERRGYNEVSTPILVHEKLWLQSGHLPLYADNMFLLDVEGQQFSLKPMNCPESTFIYRTHLRSYRDLPLRYNEFGRLHRNERSGALAGLTRVRQFIQDDAHVYVRPDQLADEIAAMLEEVRESYGWFGLTPRFAFATQPDKALGDPALWEQAEGLIREALDRSGMAYVVKPKDGTFYAPKIDIYIDDALGREWQMATIQADLTMLPEQFDLTYIDEHGQAKPPDRDPPRDPRLAGAVHRDPRRALRGGVPAVGRAGPGRDHPDRRPPRGRRQRAGRRAAGGRGPVRRGRRLRQPDAEQDPPGAGPEGPVHADPGRPRGRGADGRGPSAQRREGRSPGELSLGGPRLAPRRGGPVPRAGLIQRPRSLGMRRPARSLGRPGHVASAWWSVDFRAPLGPRPRPGPCQWSTDAPSASLRAPSGTGSTRIGPRQVASIAGHARQRTFGPSRPVTSGPGPCVACRPEGREASRVACDIWSMTIATARTSASSWPAATSIP